MTTADGNPGAAAAPGAPTGLGTVPPAPESADPGVEAMPPRPVRGAWSRRSAWGRAALVVTAVAGLLTGMMVLLAIGMWRNDMVIDDAPVRTTATVLTVSALSTGIEFVDNTGVSQRPPNGVLYPGGLVVGQQFLVEYAAGDPTLVRVAGRSAVDGLIMPGLVVAGTWLVAGPARWLLRDRDRDRDRGPVRRSRRSRVRAHRRRRSWWRRPSAGSPAPPSAWDPAHRTVE